MIDWEKEALTYQRAAQDLNLHLLAAVKGLMDSGVNMHLADFLENQCYDVGSGWLYCDLGKKGRAKLTGGQAD